MKSCSRLINFAIYFSKNLSMKAFSCVPHHFSLKLVPGPSKRNEYATTRKRGYCGGPEPPLKPQKPPLKVHSTYSGRCYYDGLSRRCCSAAIGRLRRSVQAPLQIHPLAAGIKPPQYVYRIRRIDFQRQGHARRYWCLPLAAGRRRRYRQLIKTN